MHNVERKFTLTCREDTTNISVMNSQSIERRPLSRRLAKRLLAYTTVAGAACLTHAEAEVVFTPVHEKINGEFSLDLNHDGIPDFDIYSSYFSAIGNLSVKPLVQGNRIVPSRQACYFHAGGAAAALPVGEVIGQGLPFQADATCMAFLNNSTSGGPWLFAKGRYLGFAFVIDGKEHFGWTRITMNYWANDEVAEILGYAYETIPGKPIVTGDTGHATNGSLESAPLGVLALGAPGLQLWRKEENQQ
jgi:hypothetical protein